MNNLVIACETQIKLAQVGFDNIRLMPEETIEQVRSVVIKDAGAAVQGLNKPSEGEQQRNNVKKWKIWDLEFEAHMRMLDNAVSWTW